MQIGATESEYLAQLPLLDHLSGVLNQRIVAIVKIHGMDQARLRCKLNKFPAFCTIHSKRFFADHMLTGCKNIFVYLIMQVIRRAIVNNTDLRIGKKFTVITI